MIRIARRASRSWLLASVFFLSVGSAQAQTDEQIGLYAAQSLMTGAQLSPDGASIAFLSSLNGRYHLIIEQYMPVFKRYILPPGEQLEFDWVHWASNDYLVFSGSYSAQRELTKTTETRLFSIKSNGQDMLQIIKPERRKETGSRVRVELPPPQYQDDVIDWLVEEPYYILVALDSDQDGAKHVRKIDIRDGDFKNVTRDFEAVTNWVTDQSGEVRLGYGYREHTGDLLIKHSSAKGKWVESKRDGWWAGSFTPVAFTEDPNIAYAKGLTIDGMTVFYKLDLSTGELLEPVSEHETLDVDDVVYDSTSGKPVGISYTDHQRQIDYFDPTMKKLQATVDKALAGNANEIVSVSSNRRQVLILSSAGANPGTYFLWDRDAKSLDMYSETMPKLTEDMLSAVQAVSYAARDGLTIPAYLTVPNGQEAEFLPTVILPHGGPQARDSMQYDFLSQFLASRGYAVFRPNFRGSTGYGAAFENAGLNEWGGKMQDDVTDGVHWLVDEGIADPDRICIVGWSYGGYAAAMGAVKTPRLYQCAASINGVLNLPRLIDEDLEYYGGSLWTRHMGLEGESAKSVSPYHQAELIEIPMLIIQAVDDSRVQPHQGAGMAAKLEGLGKAVEYVEIEFGGHSIENVGGRAVVLKSLDVFLEQYIGNLSQSANRQPDAVEEEHAQAAN